MCLICVSPFMFVAEPYAHNFSFLLTFSCTLKTHADYALPGLYTHTPTNTDTKTNTAQNCLAYSRHSLIVLRKSQGQQVLSLIDSTWSWWRMSKERDTCTGIPHTGEQIRKNTLHTLACRGAHFFWTINNVNLLQYGQGLLLMVSDNFLKVSSKTCIPGIHPF